MPSTTGKLVLHYIGEHGRHTELFINDELVIAGFNCNKSIMLLCWCVCDSLYIDVDINADFVYEETKLGSWLCNVIFKPQLYSKYDILMKPNAAAYAYHDLVYKKKLTMNQVLSAKHDLVLHVQNKYKIKNLEVVYELQEQEIWDNGRI